MLLLYLALSVFIPMTIAIFLWHRRKANFIWIFVSPLVGLFIFAMLIVVLVLLSGDM